MTIPITFSGSFGEASDPTYAVIASACGPRYTNVDRGTLDLNVQLDLGILGLIGKRGVGTLASAVQCPVAFSQTST